MDDNLTGTAAQSDVRPLSVTIFGVLNCVFGGLGIVSAITAMLMWMGYDAARQQIATSPIWSNIVNVINLTLSVYSLIVGFGLLKMTTWARRGTIIYAWIHIFWVLSSVLVYIPLMVGAKAPMQSLLVFITQWSGNLKTGLAYPILLIIFMKTGKVKQAFGAIEERI